MREFCHTVGGQGCALDLDMSEGSFPRVNNLEIIKI